MRRKRLRIVKQPARWVNANRRAAATPGPLEGIRVLDLSRHLAGPFAGMTLGDLGADVIKLERPGEGDDARGWPPMASGESCYFMSVNRNKRSIALDLADPTQRLRVRRLVETADVLIENFRPGGLERMGYSDALLLEWNPRLIHCAITAFGTDGPARDRPGMDLLLQAAGGLMSITGEEGRPPVRVGISLVDLIAGSTAVNGSSPHCTSASAAGAASTWKSRSSTVSLPGCRTTSPRTS